MLPCAATACGRPPGSVSPGADASGGAGHGPGAVAGSTGGVDPEAFAELRGFCDGVEPPSAGEHAQNRAAVQTRLRATGSAALVVEPGPAMSYLAGVQWGKSERPFVLVLPAEGEPTFVIPAFEARTAAEQLGDMQVALWQEHEDPWAAVARRLGSGHGTIACDGAMRAFLVEGLRGAVARRRVVDGTGVLAASRMRKSALELTRLRRANEATKAALRLAAGQVRPGMRQSEVAALVRAAQIEAGLQDVWVLALAGPAAAFPHGTREDRVIGDGELVLVDTGGALHGYRSDITRTWAVGTASAEARRAWDTVHAAQDAALAEIRPGARCGDVDAAAREVIAAAGWGEGYAALTHRLGHGIGLEVHEDPYLVPGSDRVLAEGMTMSDEPGIYVAGRFGVRLEDIVAVTADGAEVFGPRATSLHAPFG